MIKIADPCERPTTAPSTDKTIQLALVQPIQIMDPRIPERGTDGGRGMYVRTCYDT
jgi:hypothetical protein